MSKATTTVDSTCGLRRVNPRSSAFIGHRPPLPSFSSCFKSIFALHTETGNIWTHMYGCVAFIGVALWFLTRPSSQVQFMEKLIFSTYFLGAILCLGMSFIFHTVACHSDSVGKLFSKLDYAGITLLIVGSFIPWLYYAFYCRPQPMIIYITMISVLGLLAMIASLTWMLFMGSMYIGGAAIYATRIPERWFPGRCDLWFQSHQLFHTFVVVAAFIHFHAITEMAQKKLMEGSCAEQLMESSSAVVSLPSDVVNFVNGVLVCECTKKIVSELSFL
ncbi:unnamed protein product [Nippostrongylus brasiliensis]|uniref:Adiponectin receptor protein (inferred by orthology to a D. melanogaster protein) n=1 Tax=Nippostrongylus brasiliensis TaxID=27835 RepID=A0A0N4XHX6_NIPBR|nr:unnamed protein product [Nippostrongylus brasiliensis]